MKQTLLSNVFHLALIFILIIFNLWQRAKHLWLGALRLLKMTAYSTLAAEPTAFQPNVSTEAYTAV